MLKKTAFDHGGHSISELVGQQPQWLYSGSVGQIVVRIGQMDHDNMLVILLMEKNRRSPPGTCKNSATAKLLSEMNASHTVPRWCLSHPCKKKMFFLPQISEWEKQTYLKPQPTVWNARCLLTKIMSVFPSCGYDGFLSLPAIHGMTYLLFLLDSQLFLGVDLAII